MSDEDHDAMREAAALLNGQRRIVALIAELNTLYDACGVGIWLLAKQDRWEGASAVHLIQVGRLDLVEQAVEQLTTGAHT
jgi:hypothetical protein